MDALTGVTNILIYASINVSHSNIRIFNFSYTCDLSYNFNMVLTPSYINIDIYLPFEKPGES